MAGRKPKISPGLSANYFIIDVPQATLDHKKFAWFFCMYKDSLYLFITMKVLFFIPTSTLLVQPVLSKVFPEFIYAACQVLSLMMASEGSPLQLCVVRYTSLLTLSTYLWWAGIWMHLLVNTFGAFCKLHGGKICCEVDGNCSLSVTHLINME